MSKETTIINIRGVCLDIVSSASIFGDAMKVQYRDSLSNPEKIAEIAGRCICNCDNLIAEMRKQRRKLVRARYELRKEQERRSQGA